MIAFMKSSNTFSYSFSGNTELNPYIFENLKANYYSFNLNGMSHPGSGCRFDFTKV